MVKQFVVLGLVFVVAVNAQAPGVDPKDQMKAAQEGLLSLMNMGVAAIRSASKSVNEHAFQTGENVGKRLAADQKSATHSVETKMEAGKEGLKDSVQGGVSMIQTGLREADEAMQNEEVQEKAAAALAPIRGNSQFSYFNNLLETFGHQADQLMSQGIEQAKTNAKDDTAKGFLTKLQSGFNEGRAEQQKKLEELAKRSPEDLAKTAEQLPELKDGVRTKLLSMVQKAGDVTKATLDTAPDVIKEADSVAEETVKKAPA